MDKSIFLDNFFELKTVYTKKILIFKFPFLGEIRFAQIIYVGKKYFVKYIYTRLRRIGFRRVEVFELSKEKT